MGNNTGKEPLVEIGQGNWHPLHLQDMHQVVINEQSGEKGLAKTVEELGEKDKRNLFMRAENKEFLVGVLAILSNNDEVQNPENAFTCFSGLESPKGAIVVIENISYRLPDLGSLEPKEGLYILNQVLQATNIIWKELRYLPPLFEDSMVGFNSEGKCKTWLNPDFFSDIEISAEPTNLKAFVCGIFDVVENQMIFQMTSIEQELFLQMKKEMIQEETDTRSIVSNAITFIKVFAEKCSIDFKNCQLNLPTNEEIGHDSNRRRGDCRVKGKISLRKYASQINKEKKCRKLSFKDTNLKNKNSQNFSFDFRKSESNTDEEETKIVVSKRQNSRLMSGQKISKGTLSTWECERERMTDSSEKSFFF